MTPVPYVPLLARLIDTAKQQLPEIYGYSLSVPQDWWELVAKAVEALQSLGRWALQNNHRWIWVLDGLDRLDPEDQKALPWLPLTIPEGVVIMASALECPAKEILLERKFKTRTIAPLTAKEQDALIKQYLGRYTKQLVTELRQSILSHPLAGSPLFLRVLLEELRQCGRYETLAEQLTGYLSAKTIDDLYERVLERLEADGNGENVRKVMTALWASRAGLSEEELLSITELAPLQWGPIDLALEEAIGRNGSRLVFDHDYLRKAVEDRYLPLEEERRQAHSELADWFGSKEEWDERKAEELTWQLRQAARNDDLRKLLNDRRTLKNLVRMTSSSSVVQIWTSTRGLNDSELDETITTEDLRHADEKTILGLGGIELVDALADLFSCAGLYRLPLIELREKSYSIRANNKEADLVEILDSQQKLATTMLMADQPEKAIIHYKAVLDQALLSFKQPDRRVASTYSNLGNAYADAGRYEDAKGAYLSAQEIEEEICGENHPSILCNMNNLAVLSRERGDYELAESLYIDCIKRKKMILGKAHPDTLTTMENLAILYFHQGKANEALELAHECHESQVMLHGESHPKVLGCMMTLASIYRENEEISKSIAMLYQCLNRAVRLFGKNHTKVQLIYMNLGASFFMKEDYTMAEQYYRQALNLAEMPADNPRRYKLMSELADCMSEQNKHSEAILLRRQVVMGYRSSLGANSAKTWSEVHKLATDLLGICELEESSSLFLEELENLLRLLDASDFRIGRVLDSISSSFEMAERLDESAAYGHQALAHWIKYEGADDWRTNSSRYRLARTLAKLGRTSDALNLLEKLKRSMNDIENPDDWDVDLLNRASMLNDDIELQPD